MPNKKTEIENTESIDLQINSTITRKEKENFVKTVVSEVSLAEPNLVFLELEESFISNFIDMFTNQTTISVDLDDVATYITVKNYLFSLSFVKDLYLCIEKQIVHRAPSVEAIETFNIVMHKSISLLDNLILQVDKNGNKLAKLFTSKNINLMQNKINDWFGGFQKLIENSATKER